MFRYDDKIKEEARTLYLQGLGYKSISDKIREQYKNTLVHTTVRDWGKKGKWEHLLKEQREAIQTETNRTTTQSVVKHIKTLQAIQSRFLKNIEREDYEVRPHEMVNTIRLLLELEYAAEVKEVLVKEIAEKLPAAMELAGISKKKINETIKFWIESVH